MKSVSLFFTCTLILTFVCYLCDFSSTNKEQLSHLVVENVEALTQDDGDKIIEKEYVYVEKASGMCCRLVPGEYGKPNEKVTTNNRWRTCKRVKKTSHNTNSACKEESCPGEEFPYSLP